jgi:HEAT repeat protein
MYKFGKRGLPIIQEALHDPESAVRRGAVIAAGRIGPDAKRLIPDVLALQADPDPDVRRGVGMALHKIDPKRFPPPADSDPQ